MNGHDRRHGWLLAAGSVVLAAVVGVIAYNMGLSQGMGFDAADAAVRDHRHFWHHSWGLGPLFPLLFVFFWIGIIRRGWWGWGGPWGRRGYYGGWYDGPSQFDEWHRRAHQHMKETPPADDSGRRG